MTVQNCLLFDFTSVSASDYKRLANSIFISCLYFLNEFLELKTKITQHVTVQNPM